MPLASRFAAAWGSKQHRLEKAFGERLLVIPTLAGDFSAAADQSAPPFEAFGILDEPDKLGMPRGQTASDKSDPILDDPCVDFAEAQFGEGRPRPLNGFEIVAPDRAPPGGGPAPRYRVLDDLSDGSVPRAVYKLARIAQ